MNKSQTNVRVFRDTPHANISVEKISEPIQNNAKRTPFPKSRNLESVDGSDKFILDAG